nr:hypothetical protein [Tanacetum cinerariifolium]
QGLLVCAGVSGGIRRECVDVVEKAEEMREVVVQVVAGKSGVLGEQ